MKVLGKITLTLGLMIIVSLFLTSCSGGGLVTPELQLDMDEEINKIEETEEIIEDEQTVGEEAEQVDEEQTEEIEAEVVVGTSSVYLDVPYEKYAGANWCLPASGAMTFKYFGENISQAEIANAVIKDGSSSVYRMIKYARDLGFEAKYNYMTLEEIKDLLKKDIPVIAVQNYSLTLPYSHARVIIGYDDEEQEVISNDPTAGKDYEMSYSNFTALNTGINPDFFKIIVISTEDISTKNAVLINDADNS